MKTSYGVVSMVGLFSLLPAVAFLLLATEWTAAQHLVSVAQDQPVAAAVRLNEFMPDPASDWNGNGRTGDSDDEYIELFNPTANMIDLEGWQLDDAEGGSAPYVLPANSQIAAKGFLILFSSETGTALNNGGDVVRLLRPDGTVAELFSYTSTQPDEAYSKREDGGEEWTRDYAPSPGLSNQPLPQPTATDTSTPTPGPTATPFPLGVVVNEFMPDPASDWNGDGTAESGDEYIELFNTTDEPVDVGGWLLDDEDDGNTDVSAQSPGGSRPYAIPDGFVVPARGYLLFFGSETGVTLNNDGDWVRLLHPDGEVVEAFAYGESQNDQAYSKTVDGGTQWTVAFPPSPGSANLPPPDPTATPTATPSPTPPTATIGGHVFEDLDSDGRFEPWAGEVGLANVLVTLSNGRSRLTSVNGWYGWGNLSPGTYTVRQMQPVHTTSTTPNHYTITVAAGEERQDLSFGEVLLPQGQIQSPVSLNEFLPSPGSDWDGNGLADADDEWIELFNMGDQPVDVGGWFLDDEPETKAGPQGSRPYLIAPGTIVPAGGFLVFFRSTSSVALNNGGDSVRLLGPGLFELETIDYPSTGRDLSWSKRVDGGDQWTNTYLPSPGQSNQPPATPVLTPSATAIPTSIPSLEGISLNEFMPDPASDWNGDGTFDIYDEYVELYNANDGPVDLGGWQLDDEDDGPLGDQPVGSLGSRPYVFPEGTVIPGRGFLLLFRSQTGVVLNNDGDWVRLLGPDGNLVESFSYADSRDDEPYSKATDGGASWTRSYPPSPGASNAPTVIVTASPTVTATVVSTTPTPFPGGVGLNEFLPRPAHDWNGDGLIEPGDEYVELFNANQMPVDLSGWLLDDVDDGLQIQPEGSRPYRLPDGTTIPAQGHLVLYRSQTGVGLNDDGDVVRLLWPDGSEVEQHSYARADADVAYSKVVDGGSNWTSDYPPSPGYPNGPGYSPADDVRLNEFLASPQAVDWDGDGLAEYLDEWIELFNAGQVTVDLTGWKLTDDAPAGTGPDLAPAGTYLFPAGTVLAPGEFRLVFRRESGLALNATDEWIRLLYPDGTEADAVYADRFSGYDQAWCRLPDGTGSWTLNCQETPGEANQPAPGTGSKPESGGETAEPPYDRFNHDLVTVDQARTLPDDTLVTIQGRVTALPGIFGSRQAYIQDATGGILVYLRSGEWPPLSAGQWVRVNGPLDTFHGEREVRLTRIDDVKTLAADVPVPVVDIPTGDVGEVNEGRLVRISGAAVGFRGNILYLNDGTGQAAVLVLASTGTRRPYVTLGDTWTMIGIVSQRDDDPPLSEGYRLLPRGEADIGHESATKAHVDQVAWSAPPLLLPITGAANAQPGAWSNPLGLLAACASLLGGLLLAQQSWK